MANKFSSFITNLKVDITKSPESWAIILVDFVYFLLLIWPTFITVNVPGCNVGIVGYVLIFRILLVIAFLVFALRLRHITFENKGNSKWVLALSLFAMAVTVCASYGMGWIIMLEFIATVPMLALAIFIIVRYRKVVKDY